MSIRTLVLPFAVTFAASCGTDSTQAAANCADSDLIAQCPPGSNPILTAEATSMCEGSAEFSSGETGDAGAGVPGTVTGPSGHVEGACRGTGDCKVYCQFQVPCECGVESISDRELKCRDCLETAACGNHVCEGTETPDNCPQDCNCLCEAGKQRCNGDALQICEGCQWTDLACPSNQACTADPEKGAVCARTGI